MDSLMTSAAWREIREPLEQARSQIDEEIRAYPAPIPACDAQFNHLMAQRARLTRDLGRVDTVSSKNLSDAEMMAWLDDFLGLATYLDAPARQAVERFMDGLIVASEG